MHNRWIKIKEEGGDQYNKIKESRAKYISKDPEKEKERCREKAKRQYYEHREEKIEQHKKWLKNNKDHVKEWSNEYRKERYKSDPKYKFTVRMRNMINASFYRYETYKPRKNADVIGISSIELRDHLLQTFKDIYGYDWDFKEPVHIDHIVPLATAKNQEDIARLCHYTNLQLIKQFDNLSKGAKDNYKIMPD